MGVLPESSEGSGNHAGVVLRLCLECWRGGVVEA
jgi:hypothetical protein